MAHLLASSLLITSSLALTVEEQLQNAAGNTTLLKETRISGWSAGPSFRGTSSIIWSCLITIVASIYTAIHPNIPVRRVSRWRRLVVKFRWVLIALLTPEFMIGRCALRQYWEARKLVKYLNENEIPSPHRVWNYTETEQDKAQAQASYKKLQSYSMAYGFWVEMGGFIIDTSEISDVHPRVALTARGAMYLAKAGHVFDISDGQIADRSKSNALGKILVCIQIFWMALQCLTRVTYGYPLTLLEIHTMVHVLFALCLYGLWWHKPLDVDEPILLDGRQFMDIVALLMMNSVSGRDESFVEIEGLRFYIDRLSKSATSNQWTVFSEHDHRTVHNWSDGEVCDTPPDDDGLIYMPTDRHLSCGFGQRWTKKPNVKLRPKDVLRWCLCAQAMIALEEEEFTRIQNSTGCETWLEYSVMTEDTSDSCSNERWTIWNITSMVNLFAGTLVTRDREDSRKVLHGLLQVGLSLLLLPAVYCGIHLSAIGTAVFPTKVEAILWYISAAAVLGIVIILGMVLLGILAWEAALDSDKVTDRFEKNFGYFLLIGFGLSQLCRMYLVVESFISLRDVALGVYIATPWLQTFPHL